MRYLILVLLVSLLSSGNPAHAGLVLSSVGYSDYTKSVIQQAETLVTGGQYDEARDRLRLLASEQKNMLAGDVLLFELLVEKGDLGKARLVLEQFAATSPPRFDIFFGFSKLAAIEGRWFDAYVHAQLALSQPNPKGWSEQFGKNVRYETQLVLLQTCEARAVWDQFPPVFEAVEAAFAEDARLLSFKGKHAFHIGEIDQAAEYFAALKAKDPAAASSALILARLFAASGNSEKAEEWFRTGLDFSDPEDRCAIEFAQWLLTRERPSETLTILGKLPASDDSISKQTLLGLARLARGEAAAALSVLEPIAEKEGVPFAALNAAAIALSMQDTSNSNNRAYELAVKTSRSFPNQPEAFSTLGWTQLRIGQLDAAELSFAQAVRGGVISRDAAYFLSEFHREKGSAEDSQKFAKAAREGNGVFFFRSELD